MAVTSGTYNFQSVQLELLIREAYERIGILGEYADLQKLESAKRSIDFLLLEWMSKSINLWTIEGAYLSLNPGQAQYVLPSIVNNIIQANVRTSIRPLNGTAISFVRRLDGNAASSSGIANNAFDGNQDTACTQTAPNGNISYDYGVGNSETITWVGIISQALLNYVLNVNTSADNVNWNLLFTIPFQSFEVNIPILFPVNAPIPMRAYQIVETGGATLNIQELYFLNYIPNENAANAFDTDPTTSFLDILPNGNLGYDFGVGVTQNINFIGIQSTQTTLYTIVVEYSQDTISWLPLIDLGKVTYVGGVINWFDVILPVTARAYRIRETGGAILNIQEVYFNNNVFDLPISNISRYEYLNFANKYVQSRPSSYYLHRQLIPTLYIWPTPTPFYNCLFYSYTQMIQDAGRLYTDTIEIPSRFYPSLVWGLTWQLALKYKPEVAPGFKAEYDQAFSIAAFEDSEQVSFRLDIDYSNGR